MRHLFFFPILFWTTSSHLFTEEPSEIPRLRYNTCDLDLAPELLPQLPPECLEVDQPLKEKLLQESLKFKQFWEALEEHEAQSDLEYQRIKQEDPLAAAIPVKDWILRQKIYEQSDLLLCQNGTEVTYDQFADCMIHKRTDMYETLRLEVLKDSQLLTV